MWKIWRERVFGWSRSVSAFLLGASFSWTVMPYLLQYRKETDRMMALILNAQLLGLPLLPSTAILRLLPFLVPSLLWWRRTSIFTEALEGADLRHIGH